MKEVNRTERVLMRVTPDEKNYLKTKGNITAYICSLIEADRRANGTTAPVETEKCHLEP